MTDTQIERYSSASSQSIRSIRAKIKPAFSEPHIAASGWLFHFHISAIVSAPARLINVSNHCGTASMAASKFGPLPAGVGSSEWKDRLITAI
ncbi:hypothetical protein ACWIEX_02465 [Bosea sp. NPDC055353]